ncbi:GNAT family N-acetyltransferase [Histidinibacterium aquaticum]|uniref:L-ornithine N(alpha)-acyltransferase n=1 Tax=Histidinibacterium aquaticum TaxID=2613962 RepID=A0A5J5GKR6_9RHOB|nr:GNAT family N-acyltransferase [Histidinibacterium aquaticum]KAA9008889.1 GNAT family N-acetyltransferase [Histidinibacterium aquaticum]
MPGPEPEFELRIARSRDEIEAAQRLRYEVFVEELGGTGAGVDHGARLETDDFDGAAQHLLLLDRSRGGRVAGVYRLMDESGADRMGRFYTEAEYDLTPLRAGGRRLLELGRSCLHPDYRGGTAMFHLWTGLAEHVARSGAEVLFGTASFHGTDTEALRQPLSFLHHHHLAPPDLRVTAKPPEAVPLDLLPRDRVDRRAALLAIPALIKAYLRLGGFVGQGAWVDRAFNTVDVCLVMDTARLNARTSRIYSREAIG